MTKPPPDAYPKQGMKYLGIDYGEKRIGLSFGDELGFAVPLPAATAAKKKERLGQIGQIIEGRGVQCLVVGYPYNMDGTVGFKAREVDLFIATLERTFGLPVFRADERLTTDEALRRTDRRRRRSRRERNRERASGALDSHAATIILQEFLDSPEDTRGEHPPLDP